MHDERDDGADRTIMCAGLGQCSIPGQLDTLNRRMGHVERELSANTALTTQVREEVKLIHDALVTGRTLGRLLKWGAPILAAAGGAYAAVTGWFHAK